MNGMMTGTPDFGMQQTLPNVRYVDRQSNDRLQSGADVPFLPIMNPGKGHDLIAGKPLKFWIQVLLKAAEQKQQGGQPDFDSGIKPLPGFPGMGGIKPIPFPMPPEFGIPLERAYDKQGYLDILKGADATDAKTGTGVSDGVVTREELSQYTGTLNNSLQPVDKLQQANQLMTNFDALSKLGDGTGIHVSQPSLTATVGATPILQSQELDKLASLDGNPTITDKDWNLLDPAANPKLPDIRPLPIGNPGFGGLGEDIYLSTLKMADTPNPNATGISGPGGNGDGLVSKEELAAIGSNLIFDGSPEKIAAGRMAQNYDQLSQLGDGSGLHVVKTGYRPDMPGLSGGPLYSSPELEKLANLDGDGVLTEKDWNLLDPAANPLPVVDPILVGGPGLPVDGPGFNFFHPIGRIGDDGQPIVDPGFNFSPIGRIDVDGQPSANV